MNRDPMSRIAELDPATSERLALAGRDLAPPHLAGEVGRSRSRRFVQLVTAMLIVVGIGVPLALLWPLITDERQAVVGDFGWYPAGELDEVRARRILYLAEIETFVVAPAGETPYALAAASPHMDERLLFCRTSGWFFSPAHGEMFDLRGDYQLGPADRGMDRRPVRIVDDEVQIDAGTTQPGGPRDAAAADQQPSGPFCEEGSDGFVEDEPGFARPAGRLPQSDGLMVRIDEGPRPGETAEHPVYLGGRVEFEASELFVRLLGADGTILDERRTSCDSGACPGEFFTELLFTVEAEQPGTVLIGTLEADQVIWLLQVPVTLSAGPGVEPGSFLGTWYDEQGNPTYYKDEQGWHLRLHVIRGSEHCGWQSASVLTVAWPLGGEVQQLGAGGARQYVRDPNDVLDVPPPDLDAVLPPDAGYTGYHRGGWQLWVSPADVDDFVYLVAGDGTVERWARASGLIACR